jgi:hypothetical protein
MTSQEQQPSVVYGQRVRITECPQGHPDHQGQIGIAAQQNHHTLAIRVYVGMGICQAIAVELVPLDVSGDREA